MKKKNLFAPSQMVLLTGSVGEDDWGSQWGWEAKPDPNLDEEGEILFPGSEDSSSVSEGDVVVPEADSDLAYIAVPE